MKNLLFTKILGKASKNKCMVGKHFRECFQLLINEERGCRLELFLQEYIERNGSAQNGAKTLCKRKAYPYLCGTVPYRTVPEFPCKHSLEQKHFPICSTIFPIIAGRSGYAKGLVPTTNSTDASEWSRNVEHMYAVCGLVSYTAHYLWTEHMYSILLVD